MSILFTEYKLKDVVLRNRIALPPMCQYMAKDGFVNDWHIGHYTAIARGGVGLVIVEATAVSPEGRITPACLGLWNDEHIEGLAKIAKAIKDAGAVPGIQIAHAGRKASANRPWEGDGHIMDDQNGWKTISPSATALGNNLSKVPREMTLDDIKRVQEDFKNAAIRAQKAGFEWLELHFAHGYLAQSFFSIHANKRTDQYGGSAENRSRFIKESFCKVRDVWPKNLPLAIRFGVVEFDGRDEETLNESIALVKELKKSGLDFVNVSMGFSTLEANIPWGPAFMAPFAERVRNEANIPVASAWGFGDPLIAESVVQNKQLDLVMIGKAHLANPNWTFTAAQKIGIKNPSWVLPASYAHWLERYKM